MVAHLHSLKSNAEKGWEEKDLGFLPDNVLIWLVLGWNKGHSLSRGEFLFIDSFWWESLSRWCTLKHGNGQTTSPYSLEFYFGYLPAHLRPEVIAYFPVVAKWAFTSGLKWAGRCCLSIFTLGHVYPMPCLSGHHLLRDFHRKLPMKRNFFSPNHWPLF